MEAIPVDSAWGPYFDISTTGNNLQAFTQGTEALAAASHASTKPSPAASHLSPPVEGGPLSPSSTLDPSDSVSRTHSPPKSVVNLEEEIPRQSTDAENMVALGDILGRAAQYQKQLRMSRLGGRFQPPSAPAPPPTGPTRPPTEPTKLNTSLTSQNQSSIRTDPPAPAQPTFADTMDAHMMPPDPFEPNQFASSSAPVNPGSPPANPFVPSPSGLTANFSASSEITVDAAIPWTKEITITGLYSTNGSPTSPAEPVTIPVAIAATPDQNVAPELWPNTPMIVHTSNLNGPVELLSFHSMVESSAVPYCILLPYLDAINDGHLQLAALTNYERLTNTLRERKSFVRITFPVPGGPQGTGIALYPRFDHHAGTFRLLAALFTRNPVPVATPVQHPSSNNPPRKIAPLPHPLKRPSAKAATAANSAPNGMSMDTSSLLNVNRPFGEGSNGSAPQIPTQSPPIPMQAAGQPQMMYDASMATQAPFPDGVPNEYGFPMGFDPSFSAMQPQMSPDFAYYGMAPSGYPQNEDTMMGSSQTYPAGTVWNM